MLEEITIYRTDEYNRFKHLTGNRNLDTAKCKALMHSINNGAVIDSPIIVNEKMEVIDGQHRLYALEHCGKPVTYRIREGATIKDAVNLNLNQTSWKPEDYYRAFATSYNLKAYQRLLETKQKFPEFSYSGILYCIMGEEQYRARVRHGALKDGSLEYSEERKEYVEKELAWIRRLNSFSNNQLKNRCAIAALSFCYESKLIDSERLEKKIKSCGGHVIIYRVDNESQMMGQLGEIYNRDLSDKNKLWFKQIWAQRARR